MIELDLFFEDGRCKRGKFEVPVVLGRAPECGIHVSHWRIARQHLRISLSADGFHVDDLGSILGTRVNGHRVVRYGPIKETDEIFAGPCMLKLANRAVSETVSQEAIADEVQNSISGEQRNASEHILPVDSPVYSTHHALRKELRIALIKAFDLRRVDVASLSEAALRAQAHRCVSELLVQRQAVLNETERKKIIKLVVDEAIGLGVIETLLEDASITEIMVNRYDEIFVEIEGTLQRNELQFSSEEAVRSVLERIVHPIGRRIDEASPMVDARLPDGSRLNAVLPPVAIRGASFTIRKFPLKRLQMHDLIDQETLPSELADFLYLCIALRLNILVSGGTGSGKTTLLNVLAGLVEPTQRIVTIEDSAELLINHPHVVTLEARVANSEGQGAISIRDLVKNALRMRPDRIVIGEVRGPEALDLLAAMNTGHSGSISTLHANGPRDALSRLETMVLSSNVGLPLQAIREQIGSAIQLVVHQKRLPNGRRVVTDVVEILRVESGTIQMQQLTRFDYFQQKLRGAGLRPILFESLDETPEPMMLNWFLQT